ncbi:MAG: hypothetical protein IKL46_04770 [Clostridia bacterium]|nr:hypothetical protein [Clostridia bacterium]
MATSGSFSNTFKTGWTLVVEWAESNVDVANNQSDITITAKLKTASGYTINSSASKKISFTINGTTYSSTCTVGVGSGQTKTLWSKTVSNITHNSDGKKSIAVSCKLDIAVTLSGQYISSVSASGTATLTNIARASSFGTVSGNTIGGKMTVNITRQNSSFTHQLWYKVGNSAWYDLGTGIGTSKEFTIDMATCSQFPNATSGTLQLCLRTLSGTTRIGSDVYKNITVYVPDSVKPSCTLAVTDATGYADKYGAYIKGYSKFAVVVTPTTAYGSAIASYSVKANGLTYSKANFTTGALNSTGTLKVSATVKDNRGRSGSAETSRSVIDYSQPKVTELKVKRCNEDGTENILGEYAQVTFSAIVTALNNLNSAKYTLEYKKKSEATYTAITFDSYTGVYSVNEVSYIFEADSGSTYDVRIIVKDDLATTTKPTVLSTGAVLMHWRADGKGMGLGKVGEIENGLDVGYVIRANEGFINITLPENTDLNDVVQPNTYVSIDRNVLTYKNCPVTSGTFSLEVASAGDEGQIVQTITYTSKAEFRIWKRFYHSGSWGDWQQIYSVAGNVLWDGSTLETGGYYMTAGHTVTLTQKVSEQPHGITLIFSLYSNGAASNAEIVEYTVLKKSVSLFGGCGHSVPLLTPWRNGIKYLYIHDDKIVGHEKNNADFTIGGITYSNSAFVLRYVIGW